MVGLPGSTAAGLHPVGRNEAEQTRNGANAFHPLCQVGEDACFDRGWEHLDPFELPDFVQRYPC